jgi:CheY-like chemotaxis protein
MPEALRRLLRRLDGQPVDAPEPPFPDHDDARLDGMRVLLAEDNATNRQIVVELLEQAGAGVDAAANGQEAIERLELRPVGHYHVVLLDLQMPVLDGYQTAQRIRADARHAALPIFAVSAHALLEERERCVRLGMNGHISKPIEPEVLHAALAPFHRPASGDRAAARGRPRDRSFDGGVAAEGGTGEPPGDVASSAGIVRRFKRLLQDGDIEAIELWRLHAAVFARRLPRRTIETIEAALASYDFDRALRLLPVDESRPEPPPTNATD